MTKKRNRVIFHVDMDQFFAAVEERKSPEIIGKPVIVGADPKEGAGRGVVSTCNYIAREYGVRSGMPIGRAWRLCPDAVFLPVDYRLYQKVSSKLMAILKGHADRFERWGLDEAFLDVTKRVGNFKEARKLAQKIKREVFEKEKLTCSIGVGPNKLVAKIGSDFQKPDGLTIVREEDVKTFLAPLSVRKLLWVGKKTEQKLNLMGIKTVGDLVKYDASVLLEKFGAAGTQLYLSAQGIDNSPVEEHWVRKSVSREVTFEEDTSDMGLVFATLDAISKELFQELRSLNFVFKTITVKIRFENFETHTHGKTLPFLTDRLSDIQRGARDLLQECLQSDKEIRLVGVGLSNLLSTKKQLRLI